MNRTPLRRLLTGVVAANLGVSVLTSCSAQTDLDGGVAAQLQTRVAAAKQHAAEQDYPAALAELGQLSQDVATAAEQGRMSQERQNRIEAAIGAIRDNLLATPAPAPAAPAAPSAPKTDPQVLENQREQAEEAREEAEKQREDAQKEAEKQREDAQKEAEKQRKDR